MDRYEISGGRRLTGEIHVQGAKNSVLPILAATVLTADRCVIHNCPALSDTALTIRIGGREIFLWIPATCRIWKFPVH